MIGLLSGCEKTISKQQEAKLQIVVTLFPIYDWTREIVGDDAEITLLLDSGTDLHSYQPTADDMIRISTCDMFIYVGGESDAWVEDALQEAANPDRVVINLMEVLGAGAREEEIVEGMETHEDDQDDEIEYDEHVWLSLTNAILFCTDITAELSSLDQEHAEAFDARAAAYEELLQDLDARYRKMVDAASLNTVLFGDRFPFRYLMEDYGLRYYAAFSGCSAESEASFETIAFLAEKVDELGLTAILTLEGNQHRIAETILETAQAEDVQILSLDSMQSTTLEDAARGVSYVSIMETNYATLKTALE